MSSNLRPTENLHDEALRHDSGASAPRDDDQPPFSSKEDAEVKGRDFGERISSGVRSAATTVSNAGKAAGHKIMEGLATVRDTVKHAAESHPDQGKKDETTTVPDVHS